MKLPKSPTCGSGLKFTNKAGKKGKGALIGSQKACFYSKMLVNTSWTPVSAKPALINQQIKNE